MIDKKMTALLGSLLLLAAAMPATTAHLTGPSETSADLSWALDATPDDCRWEGDFANSDACYSGGVSGNYINEPDNTFITGGNVFPLRIGGVGTVFPLGYFSFAGAFCDLEVLGDGTTRDTLDEDTVDDNPNSPPGTVPDGTWDDGGVGGACHTEDQYEIEEWNTPGCGVGGTHAVAEDKVSGSDVWIGASCDQGTEQGDGFSLTGCVINELISGADPDALNACVAESQNGTVVAPTFTCGSDSFADSTSYGRGGGDRSPEGIPFVGLPACAQSVGDSIVFTFNYVTVGGAPDHRNADDLPDVVPATAGWIDSRSLVDYTAVYGPGLTIPGPTECSDTVDNDDEDGDGDATTGADAADDGCRVDTGQGFSVYNPADLSEN